MISGQELLFFLSSYMYIFLGDRWGTVSFFIFIIVNININVIMDISNVWGYGYG